VNRVARLRVNHRSDDDDRQAGSSCALVTAKVLQHWADATIDHTADPATTLQHLHERQELPRGPM
jgi:hypothetical protein